MYDVIAAGALAIAYEERGDRGGWPVVLLHGFPYDVRAYDGVATVLADRGARVVVPYLRGFGPTRFRDGRTPRSGQQAAVGMDLLALLDALSIPAAGLAGFDWGGRAACVVAALYPERVRFLVSVNGYAIQDIAAASEPAAPVDEFRLWYQYYFHGERGRRGLERNRDALCRLLWSLWSPTWCFDDATFGRTAASFANPDFAAVVVHSYRHRFGLAEGDPELDGVEAALAARPVIGVPTITIDGEADGVRPPTDGAADRPRFPARREHRRLAGVGHNVPQEAAADFADAVLTLHRAT